MDERELDNLKAAATRFRRAVEKACRSGSLSADVRWRVCFPEGSCGEVSHMLGEYLRSNGFGSFSYVWGHLVLLKHLQSHAWLRQGNVVVDITADQFEDVKDPVLVYQGDGWHQCIKIEADDNIGGLDGKHDVLWPDYQTILSHMPEE